MHGARGKTGLCVRVLEQGVLIESSKLIEKSMIHDEIDRIRFLAGTDYLRAYAARAETWELLCIIFSLQGDRRYGINDYIDMTKTARCSRLTLYKFLRDRIDCGDFHIVRGEKRSRKTLTPCNALAEDFRYYHTRFCGIHELAS